MSAAVSVQTQTAKPQAVSNSKHAGMLLQRKCACGSPTSSLTGECPQCGSKKRLQTKLTIGASNDPLEQEADRVADQVLAAPAHSAVGRALPRIQRFTGQASAPAGTAPASVDRVLASTGRPLDPALRQDMEQRFGHDFSRVRVHSGGAAEQSAREVNAHAYTIGQHIVFAPGLYAPATLQGRRLLAHELVHTLQQRSAGGQLQRWSVPGASGTGDGEQSVEPSAGSSPGSAPEAFLQPGWRDVNELGIVYKEGPQNVGGANLRATPGGALIEWLPHNTKVFVLKEHATQKAYAVTTIGKSGAFGYVSSALIKLHLPDPESRIVKVKPGDTSLGLARQHNAKQGFNDAWYADQRYVVNALYWANTHQKHKSTGPPSIEKRDTWVDMPPLGKVFVKADSDDAPWQVVQVNAGRLLWLPGADFLRSLYSIVRSKGGGTGSIKAEIWQTVKGVYNKVAYALAFIAGVIHGFVKSIWDAISGIADLLYSVFKSLLSGELISDVKDLAGSVQKLTWEGIKEALGNWADEWSKKLNDPSPWTSGHAHGYLTGYVMAEAAMLLLTGSASAWAKSAVLGSRLGKAVKGSRAFQTLEKVVTKAGQVGRATDAGFQKAVETLEKSRYGKAVVKGAEVTAKAVVWTAKGVTTALSLPGRMFVHLTDDVIARLKQLQPFFERIRALSDRAKWWLFGCHSPCKVDVKAIRNTLKNLTDDEIEAALKVIDPKTLGPRKGARGRLAAAAGEMQPLELQDVVAAAIARLKARGVKGLSPAKYGTKLHAEVSTLLEETLGNVPKGWVVGSEKRLSSLIKLDPATAKMTVRQYMKKWGMTERYPALPKDFLGTRIGRLTPDVFARAPDGRTLVWDLTSQLNPGHLAKGMFYSELIGRETGGFLRIVEDYWRKVL